MAGRLTQVKPEKPQLIVAEVTRTERVSPNLVRVTFGGEAIRRFRPIGFDQWFRLFLPREGQEVLRLPTRSSFLWYAQFLTTPKQRRPHVRNYTVRAYRAAGGELTHPELDVDFVVHGAGSGPASDWAVNAQPGTTAGILDEGSSYAAADDVDWHLIAADETGLPAAVGVLARLPRDAVGHAWIELPDAADVQPVQAPAGVTVNWLPRSDPHAVPGVLARESVQAAITAATLPSGRGYAHLVGESALVTGLRRHLVAAGMPKSDVTFIGYWRMGHAAVG
ncbi:siderophore-interacting protein [Herbiconiux sp. CPCC 205763]|uniref:Siderophore-interacting protein n=1 Tax=Herbiconiux aconitum TaxID=2970913 RepID=A0ABT2GL81_9MICO|nr:siderophore-interacting protein [Herbiconiux aconitum]MCS5716979.1 siderophore-interacting protein [Herbiconiux aconitum]